MGPTWLQQNKSTFFPAADSLTNYIGLPWLLPNKVNIDFSFPCEQRWIIFSMSISYYAETLVRKWMRLEIKLVTQINPLRILFTIIRFHSMNKRRQMSCVLVVSMNILFSSNKLGFISDIINKNIHFHTVLCVRELTYFPMAPREAGHKLKRLSRCC